MIRSVAIWFISRVSVRERFILHAADLIKAHVRDQGCSDNARIPDRVYVSLAQEAFRRAAMHEDDGKARWGSYIDEIKKAGEAVGCFLCDRPFADLRVKQILEMGEIRNEGEAGEPTGPATSR